MTTTDPPFLRPANARSHVIVLTAHPFPFRTVGFSCELMCFYWQGPHVSLSIVRSSVSQVLRFQSQCDFLYPDVIYPILAGLRIPQAGDFPPILSVGQQFPS